VGLEEEAEIEHGVAQNLALAQDQRDQQAPQTAVSVEEGMDGLELHMRQSRLEQR
jgi:hypothetical protein